ncbi:MAG: fructose-6-phosphate aldolase [Spirochaetia bacterium]|jgi:TalC/MipB family fructose-6-phosphate aldolase|nr:fructose-6-phosphate aldolase [Spirochaetia bacterium]
MELLLDTANLEDIADGLETFAVSGVTTNPTILKAEGKVPFFDHLCRIRKLIGDTRSLHVQVVGNSCEEMVKEAGKIRSEVGKQTYIKVPVTSEGLKAIQILAPEGVNVTATAIYSTFQGMMASISGAKYLAVYYNRMKNIDVDPDRAINDISKVLPSDGSCSILAASFHNIAQVTSAYAAGARACTVGYKLLAGGLCMPSVQKAAEDFHKDWVAVYGNRSMTDM